ncbi:Uncharacterised protein [Mycobacterium tuberculosis]|nr:Uncharacterised protein [Mycobacterium tuberculosis]
MDMRVDAAGRDDFAFACNHFCRCPDHHARLHTVHQIRIARLAYAGDDTVFNSDIGFHNPAMVYNHGIRNQRVKHPLIASMPARLSHAVPNHFAAAEFALIAIDGIIIFNFRP